MYRKRFGQLGNWMQRHWLIKFQRTQKCLVNVYFWVTSRVACEAIASFQNSRDTVLLRSYLDRSSGKARDDPNVLRTSPEKKCYANVWHALVIIPGCLPGPHVLASNCQNPVVVSGVLLALSPLLINFLWAVISLFCIFYAAIPGWGVIVTLPPSFL